MGSDQHRFALPGNQLITDETPQTLSQTTDDGASEIIANNCVYHELAAECRQVCELDLSLMETLLEARVEHRECMVRGGHCCRFEITPR